MSRSSIRDDAGHSEVPPVLIGLVRLPNSPKVGPVKHYYGFPLDLLEDESQREQLPFADVVIMEQKQDGVFLVRFTRNGSFAGETWHQSREDAEHQSQYEFGALLAPWLPAPPEEQDVLAYALKLWRQEMED